MTPYSENPFYRYDYEQNKYVLIENGIPFMMVYYNILHDLDENNAEWQWTLDLWRLYNTIESDLHRRGLI